MRLHSRQATPTTLTATTTAAAASTKHTTNHNSNVSSTNLKATTKTNSNKKQHKPMSATTTLHKIKIKKVNSNTKQQSSNNKNCNNNNIKQSLKSTVVANNTNNINNMNNDDAKAAADAVAAKTPNAAAEEEMLMSEDVETTAVEMRSTSLHFRGAYNTWRSNSTSAIIAEAGSYPTCMAATSCGAVPVTSTSAALYTRPRTLNVHNARQTPTHQTQMFFGEVLNAWRAKARCNVVPDERTQELFQELSFHPSQKQISEMLQTAKKVARKSSSQSNGLTFGQFCVLAADLKRFRTSALCDVKYQLSSSFQNPDYAQTANDATKNSNFNSNGTNATTTTTHRNKPENPYSTELRSTKSFSSVDDTKKKKTSGSEPVEVFLGGSCNPTTWRADVAIPALKELGISFYNPQVSDWTPDLIELEHRAKEKARVLFFVMDSETRASAGAIEAAHIAGQNCKQLVLVLHPYKANQKILNEPLSEQEYLDLSRNQMILKELVTRRGLPVLDNIPSGLQRTKEILSGICDPPTKISSILDAVRGAFDRVNPINEILTVEQCQRALLFLGYAQSLLNLDNLNKIIINQRESLKLLQASTKHSADVADDGISHKLGSTTGRNATDGIDFDLFCVISAYLSVLQQEIHDSGCISPIKGTNVPPPPVYFTNAPDVDIYFSSVKNISRTSSNASVPSNSSSGIGSTNNEAIERQNLFELLSRSRDSGTSSPQPQVEQPFKLTSTSARAATQLGKLKQQPQILLNVESIETTEIITTKTIETNVNAAATSTAATNATTSPLVLNSNVAANNAAYDYTPLNPAHGEESDDSNDSVFSSSSSIASVTGNLELCDVYLGGSCMLRSKWRQEIAVPYLKAKGISYHMPALHESIKQQNFGACSNQISAKSKDTVAASVEPAANVDKVHEAQQHSFVRTRRKCRGAQLQLEEEEELTVAEESWSWSLPPMGVRTSLYNPALLDSSRVLLFVITKETRSLAPMTLAAHCIGLMYNVVLAVQMLPEDCTLGNEKLTSAAIKDYNRGRSYLIDLAKRQGVPVFNDIHAALECTVAKIQGYNNRNRFE